MRLALPLVRLTPLEARRGFNVRPFPTFPFGLPPRLRRPAAHYGFQDRHGNRFDSTPIANGIVNSGMACDLINYTVEDHEEFVAKAMTYDGLILRINQVSSDD